MPGLPRRDFLSQLGGGCVGTTNDGFHATVLHLLGRDRERLFGRPINQLPRFTPFQRHAFHRDDDGETPH